MRPAARVDTSRGRFSLFSNSFARGVEDSAPYDAWGTYQQPSNVGYSYDDGQGWNPAPTGAFYTRCMYRPRSGREANPRSAMQKYVVKFRDTDDGQADTRFKTGRHARHAPKRFSFRGSGDAFFWQVQKKAPSVTSGTSRAALKHTHTTRIFLGQALYISSGTFFIQLK